MKKRIATPFLSHEEWTSSIKEDYNYIKKHFKHPERLHIEYSKYFGFHLNMLFRDMRNNFFNNLKTNFKKVPHWMIFLEKLYFKYYNSDAEPFTLYIIHDLMKFSVISNNIESFFYWFEKLKKCSIFTYREYNHCYLSIKFIYHYPINQGIELLGGYSINDLKISQWGKKHLNELFNEVNNTFSARQTPYILDSLINKDNNIKCDSEYSDTNILYYHLEKYANIYSFDLYSNELYYKYVMDLCREAENNLRIKYNMCKIGEGWVEETNLYTKLCSFFPELDIIHHYKAKWLEKQHIDIFIKDINTAIEYQGEQHYKPVERFGGAAALKTNIKRDNIKLHKCLQNKIILIRVYPKYIFDDITTIISRIKDGKHNKYVYDIGELN